MRSSNIGGQAVMEGIMMRHKDKYSIAVRRPDNEIELKVEDYRSVLGNAKFLKYPLIRGVVSFIDSLVVGTKCLMYSAEIAGDEEDEEDRAAERSGGQRRGVVASVTADHDVVGDLYEDLPQLGHHDGQGQFQIGFVLSFVG